MRRFVSSTFIALTLMSVGLTLAGCGSGGSSGGDTSSQDLSDTSSVAALQTGGQLPADSSTPVTTAAVDPSAAPVAKQLALAWDPVSGATSYNLYWSTSPGVTAASGTKISVASNSYVHTGLAAGTTYYYVVTAANSSSESAASISASGRTI